MSLRTVIDPPTAKVDADGSISGGWWHETGVEGRVICDLCPRECNLKPGDRGFCFVRKNVDGEMKLTTFGRSTGFCIDPIEKKPLNHFLPGTPVLSFGTAGCNLGCKFCQNWDISKSREVDRLSELALPEMIAAAAVETGCRSVAYTYNDPIIWAEYAIETARACRERNIKSVAVTAGYISPNARAPFFHAMDAANVDLKAFDDEFYQRVTYSSLQPVLETLRWLKHESDVWFEITNLLIPQANDSPDDLRRMCDWILEACGADVPVHFTAFHPDFRMTDRPRTPTETLVMAREIAMAQGIRFAYVGNVHDVDRQSTWCPDCGTLLIERDWHQLGEYALVGGKCGKCNAEIAGHFEEKPGTWGRQRQPIQIKSYERRHDSDRMSSTDSSAVPSNVQAAISPSQPTSSPPAAQSRESSIMSSVELSPELTFEQEAAIHTAACEIVTAAVHRRPARLSDPTLLDAAGTVVMGAFVTVKRNGQLRGCCGSLGQPMTIIRALTHSALRTVTDDHRFPPVSASELPFLTLDVTLLFNFEPIEVQGEDRVDEVQIGKHGLRISRGVNAGLLLPVVAVENNWDAETFLQHVCRKAGLSSNAWLDADTTLMRFEGRMIERELDEGLLESMPSLRRLPNGQPEVETLALFARNNIIAHLRGAIPGVFPANCSDGTVDGLALQMTFEGMRDDPVVFSQLQLRGGYPLQTTLLKLTEMAAQWLRNAEATPAVINGMTIDLILFADPAMHGPVETADLRGLDPRSRAILVRESSRTAWHFDQKRSADELLELASEACQVVSPRMTQVLSLEAVSSAPQIGHANVPPPEKGEADRPPSVAGKFYPSADGALAAIVGKCIGEIPATKTSVPAAMVPHAGLQYSGKIAAAVLKQIEIPETVIIIGPKHTRRGVDWAVAPHKTWQLPHQTIASDPTLARKLAEHIDGLQLDSAAHAQEHCIEVELPLLAKLAPNAKVVGITIGSGSFESCRKFGRQLSEVIASLDSPPLLIISSDMNHFGTDEENRHLDELALSAMNTLDAKHLLTIVREKNISMCGVLPAVIVMECLKALNKLSKVTRVSYGTSGDVTGDTSRVVGYAGVLLQ